MKVNELLCLWEKTASGDLTAEHYSIQLPVEEAAKLQALADLYPRRSPSDLITDLLSAALNEVESSMPYVRGQRVVARDEEGDPLYEDIGPTPKYLSLTNKHLNEIQRKNKSPH